MKRRRRPSDKYQPAIDMITREIAGHVMTDRSSRSFDFRTPGKGSFYAYSVTWSPGAVTLAGDIGEMTVTHWHAMATFEAAMRFLATSHWDYLLGKAGSRPDEFDGKQTAIELVAFAREGYDTLRENLAERYPPDGRRGAVRDAFWRKEIEDELDALVSNGESPGRFVSSLMNDSDYYGSYRRPADQLHRITAIQHAARMIIAAEFPDQAEAA